MTNSPEPTPKQPLQGPVQIEDLTQSQFAVAEMTAYLTTPQEGLAAAQAPYYEAQGVTPDTGLFSPATQAAIEHNPDLIPKTVEGFMSPYARANLRKLSGAENGIANSLNNSPRKEQQSKAKLPGVVPEHRLALGSVYRAAVAANQEARLLGANPAGYAQAEARMRKAGFPNDPSIAPLRRGLDHNNAVDDARMPSANRIGRSVAHNDYQGDLGGGTPGNPLRIGGLVNRSPEK